MIECLSFVIVMLALAWAGLTAFIVWDMLGRRGPRTLWFFRFESTIGIEWPLRLAWIVIGLSTFLIAYAIPLAVERVLLQTALSPWLVCVFWADFPGAALLYRLGLRKTAVAIYVGMTLFEAALLSQGMTANELMMLTNIGPAVALGTVIAERSTRASQAI